MGEALWADVATEGLGGSLSRKALEKWVLVGIPATSALGLPGNWAGQGAAA
jgi:hypothetical protein